MSGDWFIIPPDEDLKFTEIEWLSPVDYTMRYCRVDNDHAFAQEQYSQDHYYFAWCPELPGCAVWSYDAPDTIQKLKKTIPIVIENMRYNGQPIPAPLSHRTVTR